MIPEGEPIPVGFIPGMLPRSKEKIEASNEKRKQTCLDKYGGVAPLCSDSIKEKAKETNLRRYGVVSPTQSKEIQDKVKKTNLKRYGVECTFQGQFREKQKRTCLQKYGVENPFQSEEVKAKIRKTNLEKYGVEYAIQSKEAQEKRDRTNIERYGTTNPVGLEFIKDKRKKTCRERYGVDNPWESKEIFEKAKRTFFERYGVDNPMHSEEIKNRLRENNIKKYGVPIPSKSDIVKEKASNTCMKKYGVPWSCMRPEARMGYSNDSSPNKEFELELTNAEISFEREFNLNRFSYDFKVGNILIEINPSATHNSAWSPFSDHGISDKYHLSKTLNAERSGYHCIHVFDWDSHEDIINTFLINHEISEEDKSKCFEKLSDNVYNFNESNVKSVHNIPELIKDFVSSHPRTYLTTYSDRSKFPKFLYSDLGFKEEFQSDPFRIWYNFKENIFLGYSYDSEETLIEDGFVPVYDCGHSIYTLKNV